MTTLVWIIGGAVLLAVGLVAGLLGWALFNTRKGFLRKYSRVEPALEQLVYDCLPFSHIVFQIQKGREFVQVMKVEEEGDEKLLIFIPSTSWSTGCLDRIEAIFDDLDISHKMLRPRVGKYREPQLVGNLLLDYEVAAIVIIKIFSDVYENPPNLPIWIKLEGYKG